jgi:protocatechuate 3,4-dioxygenase beta subunit
MTRSNAVNRREALTLVAITAAGGALMSRSAFAQEAGAGAIELITGADVCVITPEVTEGPFYFDPALERRDITEGRPGLPTTVRLQVVDATCQPISGARVDIWHADATGLYSGYSQPGGVSTEGETFMRGTQFADASGIVEFQTVYPGWYRGRTTHIHFKVFVDQTSVLTGQIFFPDEVSDQVYSTIAPYNERGEERDTFNDNDRIAQQAKEASVAAIEAAPDRYLAQLIIGVA